MTNFELWIIIINHIIHNSFTSLFPKTRLILHTVLYITITLLSPAQFYTLSYLPVEV